MDDLDPKDYILKVTRAPGVATADASFFVRWETNLTWFFGPRRKGDALQVICTDTTDAYSKDEMYGAVIADGVRYPAGSRPGEAADAVWFASFNEETQVELTDNVIRGLGQNRHGGSFAQQMAVRYVDRMTIELLEEDDPVFTGNDDVWSHGFGPLGPKPGTHPVPGGSFFEGDYGSRGGSLSHEHPALPCVDDTGCGGQPAACRGGFCQQRD
jgi:hypothetical protein